MSIFISYRRSDSQAWTGRIAGDLRRYYGSDVVYRDVDTLPIGQDFMAEIDRLMGDAKVAIAVIGPQWLTMRDAQGRTRIDQSEDFVRGELEACFERGLPVVPVLVGGAEMPSASDLPPSLERLARLNAPRLSDEDWAYDLTRLIETLEKFGIRPVSPVGDDSSEPRKRPPKIKRFHRKVKATRRRALDTVVDVATHFRYDALSLDVPAATVTFKARYYDCTVKVADDRPGYSDVTIEFRSPRLGYAGAAAAATVVTPFVLVVGVPVAVGILGWRVLEDRFAKGFLDNVEGLIEGRGIGEDSARFPGAEKRDKRNRPI